MRVGVALSRLDSWQFFHHIYENFKSYYDLDVFQFDRKKYPIYNEEINYRLFQKKLERFMNRNEVVFFEWASGLLVAATHLPKVSGIVTRLHRFEMYQWVNKVNWDVVDKIIVVSHAKKDEFLAKFPSQGDKMVVIGPSTSLERFACQPKEFNGDIGILCHLTPRKRVYELILTFYELLQHKKNLHLHIAGGMDPSFEDYYYSLQSIVTDLGIQGMVTFYGNVTDAWNWYHKIDIFISNSYSEGLQVAPMEAMASGCYCLSHRWRGADELLPQEYLYYTDNELQKLILQYCDASSEDKLTQKQRMRALAEERFDINQTIRQITQAIDEVALR